MDCKSIRLISSVLLIFTCTTTGVLLAQKLNKVSATGIWISAAELATLPTSGAAWDKLKAAADKPLEKPDLSARKREQVDLVAKALVYARTDEAKYRTEVVSAIRAVMGTEGGDALATFRALGGYVIAADLIDLRSADSSLDNEFRNWLRSLLDFNHKVGTRALVATHEVEKANNWGTAAGFSRAAIAVYLGDTQEIERTAQVFKGWLGDRDSYKFPQSAFGSLSWQADPDNPVGINPKGSTKQGHSIDGVLPDDQRRGGSFKWPPPKENYVYTALQGTLPTAVILYRAGYDVWNWEDKAILRAFEWLYDVANFPPTDTDDVWLPWLVDYYYATNGRFNVGPAKGAGKTMDWTDWTHGNRNGNGGTATAIGGMVQNVANGGPVENATIQLNSGSQVRYQTTSNSSGRYSFNNIEAGAYILVCSKQGFESWTGNVTVAEGQQLFGLNIPLTPLNDSIPPAPPENVNVIEE